MEVTLILSFGASAGAGPDLEPELGRSHEHFPVFDETESGMLDITKMTHIKTHARTHYY